MAKEECGRRFTVDTRGVSEVLGFILIFGLLMLTLAVYQAQVVPQQNAQTEFEHFETTQDELVELRNSISTAGQAGVSQFSSITLGTTYRTRLLTINPAPPAGTIQTSDRYPIVISNGTEQTTVTTRFVEYQPGYNEIIVGSTHFEHSVLYLDERARDDGVQIIEEQNLLKDGSLRLTALQNAFQETGTDRKTLELYPQDAFNESEFPDPAGENLTVTVPTRLDDDEYWDETLSGGMYQGVDTEEHDDETHALNLSVDEADLEINTVGIGLRPDEGPAKSRGQQAITGTDDSTGGGFDKLNASVDSKSNNPDNVIIDEFSITDGSEVTFAAAEANGDTAEVTVSNSTGENITLDLGGNGNNRFPVTVIADITGGECLEATFADEDDTAKSRDDGDWETCGS